MSDIIFYTTLPCESGTVARKVLTGKMIKVFFIIILLIISSCSSVHIPESTQDPNDPNRDPILVSAGELEYPYNGTANLEGFVEVELFIDTSGTVTNVRVVKRQFNANAVLIDSGELVYVKDIVDEPLISFYKQCRYLPALRKPCTF